jgi:hypothetical protein
LRVILLLLVVFLLLPAAAWQVVFDEFGVQLTGWLVKLPKQLPEVRC